MRSSPALLLDGEPAPVCVHNSGGASPVVLVCEHAGRAIPKALAMLGLEADQQTRHFAWDIGAGALARGLSGLLDAPLITQHYSRLVYDCNRPFDSPTAIPETGEEVTIPGNAGLSDAARARRLEEIYQPLHDQIEHTVNRRMAAGPEPVLVTIHSFTPVFFGQPRTVELGILHDQDAGFADLVLDAARKRLPDTIVRRNEPYGPEDGVTHTIKVHGLSRAIAHVMIEVRNDLIGNTDGQQKWAAALADVLNAALAALRMG